MESTEPQKKEEDRVGPAVLLVGLTLLGLVYIGFIYNTTPTPKTDFLIEETKIEMGIKYPPTKQEWEKIAEAEGLKSNDWNNTQIPLFLESGVWIREADAVKKDPVLGPYAQALYNPGAWIGIVTLNGKDIRFPLIEIPLKEQAQGLKDAWNRVITHDPNTTVTIKKNEKGDQSEVIVTTKQNTTIAGKTVEDTSKTVAFPRQNLRLLPNPKN